MHTKLTKRNQQTGFTIIEVVLVLAIAGLIFLIVFLALPQLQKSRRDTQRKNDLGLIMGSLDTYASNNSGKYPASLNDAAFKATISADLKDPLTGESYKDNFSATEVINPTWTGINPSLIPGVGAAFAAVEGPTPTEPGTTGYSRSAKCNGSTSEGATGNASVAILIKLESGQYCLDNS